MAESNALNVVKVKLVQDGVLHGENRIRNQIDAVKLMLKELSTYDREILCILNLKTNSQVINMSIVSIGSINAGIASCREIYKPAVLSNAASIIVMHNHPSGDPTPSWNDVITTERIRKAGEILDIEMLDHIIVGGNTMDYVSFSQSKILAADTQNITMEDIKNIDIKKLEAEDSEQNEFKAVGECIQALREQCGIGHKELADKILVSEALLAGWENGQAIPDLNSVKRIAETVGADAMELIKLTLRCEDIEKRKYRMQEQGMEFGQNKQQIKKKKINR